jgi:hypothetical protein
MTDLVLKREHDVITIDDSDGDDEADQEVAKINEVANSSKRDFNSLTDKHRRDIIRRVKEIQPIGYKLYKEDPR